MSKVELYNHNKTTYENITKIFAKEPKFAFPKDTNETLVKWFNNIYDDLTAEETEQIWKCVSAHPKIEEISYQIWQELNELVEYGEGWSIC